MVGSNSASQHTESASTCAGWHCSIGVCHYSLAILIVGADEIIPVHGRHDQVEQENVRVCMVCNRKAFQPIGRRHYAKAFLSQIALHYAP